jgi:hypothetical protein
MLRLENFALRQGEFYWQGGIVWVKAVNEALWFPDRQSADRVASVLASVKGAPPTSIVKVEEAKAS